MKKGYVDEQLVKQRKEKKGYEPTEGFYKPLYPLSERKLKSMLAEKLKLSTNGTMVGKKTVTVNGMVMEFNLGKQNEYWNGKLSLMAYLHQMTEQGSKKVSII